MNNDPWKNEEYPTDNTITCGWVAPNQCQGPARILHPFRIKIAKGIEYSTTQAKLARTETTCYHPTVQNCWTFSF